ncbi:hypothetical protein [uncultured Winogradskyella sp.]|uniref:hypothetical protein n=1 Tax=Winogradskyella sp. 4-2091 TaxID=3381659 RepID=UPI00260F0C37|nr:hypothetical protein [uncultured Winogradskyella sp.]
MKKSILFLVFSIALSSSLFAQSDLDSKIEKKVNAYIERVESKVTLTAEEKETLRTLNTAHAKASLEINETYEKGSDELKAKRKENNKTYGKALKEAFGDERAKEIKNASKKNKGKGKGKGKKKKKN